MILNLIIWIMFGAIIGWIASMIMTNHDNQNTTGSIMIGIFGAFLGGITMKLFGTDISGFNLGSLLVAVFFAIILIFLMRVFGYGKTVHR